MSTAAVFTTAFRNKVWNAALNQTDLIAPTLLTCKLYTVMPDQLLGTGGTEVSSGTYAAQNVTASFATAASGLIDSNAQINFGDAAGSFNIVGWAIFDETPTLFLSGVLAAPVAAVNGSPIRIASGAFDLSCTT